MANIGITQALPNDALRLVFEELRRCDAWSHYCGMRLLCKAVNEIIEPEAFSSVTIGFTEQNMNTILDLLPMLAAGTTPYARWTKYLRVHNLVPLAEDGRTVWDRLKPGPNRERLLACQNEWLVPAIKSLLRVEEVELRASSREPYQPALSALAELPQLRRLKVWFNHPFQSGRDVSFSRFSNLEVIELHDVVLSSSILKGVKQLVANSPSLQRFVISRYRWSVDTLTPTLPYVTFDTVIEALIRAPAFTPTLKQLGIDVGGFHLNGSCFPFLACLTHLDIRGLSPKGISPTFWRSLEHSGIHLLRLAVQPLDPSIIDYLLSYDGLQEIVFKLDYTWSAADGSDMDTFARRFFYSVVPRHQDTLREIRFGCSERETWEASAMVPWIFNETYLEPLSLCKLLERVDVVFFYPSPNEKVRYPAVPLEILLSTASTSLTRLQELALMHVRNFHKYTGSSYAHKAFYNKVAKAFTTYVRRAMDICGEPLPFALSAMGPSCTSTGQLTRYHIAVESGCSEKAGDEEDVSDSDADSVISSDSGGCTGIYLCD